MSDISLSAIKFSHQAREWEEKKQKEKRRNLLVLIKQFLKDEGFTDSYKAFEAEAKIPDYYTVCDNVDLGLILQDYETYYNLRFQKNPKICKKDTTSELQVPKATKQHSKFTVTEKGKHDNSNKKKPSTESNQSEPNNDSSDLQSLFSVSSLSNPSSTDLDFYPKMKMLKPICNLPGYNEEWKSLADTIAKEILTEELSIKWDDVIGLDDAKRLLRESLVYPTKYPELFRGILTPWKGLLLYGPPGTGKTLLAKAVATECNTTFFNISASTIVSKWRGDSEKLVRVMFEMSRLHAPSTVFIDELDSLLSCRGSASEHEASKRLKAEILIQLDGLLQRNENVFLLTTSNMPWELDPAILRRLEKQILVDLPDKKSREKMFQYYLPKSVFENPKLEANLNYSILAEATNNYSGSDIKLVCKEAVMGAMRHVFNDLESVSSFSSESSKKQLKLKPLTNSDVLEAVSKMSPSTPHYLTKYKDWKTS